MAQERFVAYRRSSTPSQTIGLEMQQSAINDYVRRTGTGIIASYQDVGAASPTQARLPNQQPQLVRALEQARAEKASLIVARLDRLTRSTAVLALLLECGPKLLVVETPNASPFVLQIYAAAAEEYRRQVSRRVKAGIVAAQAKGRDTHAHAYRSGRANQAAHRRYADRIRPIVESIRRGRRLSQGDVAAELNARGLRTVRGLKERHCECLKWNARGSGWVAEARREEEMSSAEDDRPARGTFAKLKAAWGRLAGARTAAESDAPRATAVEYKGYRIRPAPYKTNGQYQTAGVIEKDFPDGVKEHRFIRAETHQSLDSAIELALAKGKQIIDQRGDRIFI